MAWYVWAVLIVSVLLIVLVGLQGKNSEDVSSAILGGDRDLELFKDIKERGWDLFLTRATIVCTIVFFALLGVILWQGGVV